MSAVEMLTQWLPFSSVIWALRVASSWRRGLTATVVWALAGFPSASVAAEVAVITVVPSRRPVTTPFSSTAAMLSSWLVQVRAGSKLVGSTRPSRATVSPA